MSLTLPPLSLYIHVPWCIRKCPYCDFNSHRRPQQLPEQEYIDTLLTDLQQDHEYCQGRRLHSVFIGGGTPSLFSAESYARLFEGIDRIFGLEPGTEITLEANPGTFEQEKFSAYRRAGINRLSIGVQSFEPSQLEKLGRVHSADEAVRAAAIAHHAGFDNFNLDLMFGLPGQTVAQGLEDIQTATGCDPAHISWYQLTIEPNTEFYRYPPRLPTDELCCRLQDEGRQMLSEAGYRQYEISAYSRDGRQCRHNLNYWQFGDYIGIGAGAHGKVTLPDRNTIIRTRKTRQPDHYLDPDRNCLAACDSVAGKDLALEFMMNALRLSAGSDLTTLSNRTGLEPKQTSTRLATLQDKGLLELEGENFRPTPRGLQFLNELLLEFF